MRTLTLKNRFQGNSTVVENEFIDTYMAKANGEFVKVFLLLLRHLQSSDPSLTVSGLADHLDCTEKDIYRAFKYWAKTGLLKVDYDDTNTICGLCIGSDCTIAEPGAPSQKAEKTVAKSAPKTDKRPAKTVSSGADAKQLKQLYFVAEQYLGRTLSATDIKKINSFCDELGFSVDLIEYLIEYCVENGHKSMHYIGTVALRWAEDGITTIEKAKESSMLYNKSCFSVLSALGIKGRAPATLELSYIRRWTEEYGFTIDIIVEACNRTIANTSKADFKYTDSILKSWLQNNVQYVSDIAALDAAYQQRKSAKKASSVRTAPSSGNKFQNFEGRGYDMDSLEEQLLGVQ